MDDLYLLHLSFAERHAASAVKDLGIVENQGHFTMEESENYLVKRLNTVRALIKLHKIMESA